MHRKWIALGIALVVVLAGAQAAFAKEQYVYSVKYVCGFNPTNIGLSSDFTKKEGEPPVKFGNYATEINILWPEIYIDGQAFVFKHIVSLVEAGKPVGREPKVIDARKYVDSVQLGSLQGTMDDCNRILELLTGAVPTPMPLYIGYFVLTSTHELEVTAVHTAEVCTNWKVVPGATTVPECLDSTANSTSGMGISIDVERIPGRTLLLQ